MTNWYYVWQGISPQILQDIKKLNVLNNLYSDKFDNLAK